MEGKLFTVEEAARLLPEIEPAARALAFAAHALRDAEAEVQAMVQRHGEDKVDTPANPDRARYWELVRQARHAEARAQELLDDIQFRGVEVKDPLTGLLDFRIRRDGEVVYLCWRLGEERIAHWHGLTAGFAGRKPLEELTRSP